MRGAITLLLRDAAQLVTMGTGRVPRVGDDMEELGIIEGGSVAISGSTIVDSGPMAEVEKRNIVGPGTSVIECHGQVITPGFVDSHTHPVFREFRVDEYEMRSAGMSYQDIASKGGGIASSVRGVRDNPEEDLLERCENRLDGFIGHGTTTIEAKSGYGLTSVDEVKSLRIINELGRRHSLDMVPTFLGAHAVPPEYVDNRRGYLDLLIEEMIPTIAGEGLAEYCDVFVEKGYYTVDEARELLTAAAASGMRGRVHADELSSGGGAELAAEMGAITADHLVHVSETGIRAMAARGVIAVLLPGTTFFLGSKKYAPVRKMIEQGIAVPLATDFSPGSCTTLNLQEIMSIAVTQMGVSPAEALTFVTVNGACAVGMEGVVGSIERGKRADLAIVETGDYREISYLFGINHCTTGIKVGVVAAG